jgi:hypothetical protein
MYPFLAILDIGLQAAFFDGLARHLRFDTKEFYHIYRDLSNSVLSCQFIEQHTRCDRYVE